MNLALKGEERAQAILDFMRAFIDRHGGNVDEKINVDWSRVNDITRAQRAA